MWSVSCLLGCWVCLCGGRMYFSVFLCVLAFCVSFVSRSVMMSGWVLCTRCFNPSILFLKPFMLI